MSKSSAAGREREGKDGREQATTLCLCVMAALGKPVDFLKISAISLWEGRYRVNVQTGADAASARITHSFFVVVDERGKVVESYPQITRQY